MVSPPSPIGAALYRWRSAPEPTGGDPAFGPEAPGSIPCRRRPGSHQPPGLWSTCDGYSSRSQPVLRDVGAEYGRAPSDASSPRATGWAWRRGWDSNPRSLSTLRFSRAPPSTARPPLRGAGYQRVGRDPRRTSGVAAAGRGSSSPSERRTNGSQASAPSDCASTARISRRPGTTSATLGTTSSSDRPRSTSTGPRETGFVGSSPEAGPMLRFGTPLPPLPDVPPPVPARPVTSEDGVAVGAGRSVGSEPGSPPPATAAWRRDGSSDRASASGSGRGPAGSAAG